ncbi:hypothetical protein ASPACDRAFT_56093 [Aspergillus aculeatus ATCC 16872]|uniref:Uncharacterized protein n=1 Tax=Aspergillus aculeatus (strain ATCC 16872 / CBS 172.66 / WB 5094) TaxID=690307 RepID=A0A1L9X8H4_ASPA1|nr:uncharacterized protein ASPACDRAFT_56093 [Aspergillus aculeatus ATCC 16872]OJK04634.1 hypothetical protein ASPACDRAFT_56093 [Aspergillus aculeatus ATCC 16872]
MRTAIVFLWLLAFFSGNAFAQVVGGSALAHCFEAIYLYYGYLADIAINGDERTLGRQCTPLTGTVCTVWEFIKSIETPFDAASLGDGGGIGDTTRPDDLLELAEAMYDNGFDRYNSETMFGEYVKHTLVLEKATNILIAARDNHPEVLQGALLAKAKTALASAHAEREQDMLADKKSFVRDSFSGARIIEKTVSLEAALLNYQDIDWLASAEATAAATNTNVQDRLDGFEEMGRNLATDQYDPEKLQIHVKIAQSIRTQSDALGSLATCKALG